MALSIQSSKLTSFIPSAMRVKNFVIEFVTGPTTCDSNLRRRSAIWLAHWTAAPPPCGLMNGDINLEPMSRHAPLMRSSAPIHVSLTFAAPPANLALSPCTRRSMVVSASNLPSETSLRI